MYLTLFNQELPIIVSELLTFFTPTWFGHHSLHYVFRVTWDRSSTTVWDLFKLELFSYYSSYCYITLSLTLYNWSYLALFGAFTGTLGFRAVAILFQSCLELIYKSFKKCSLLCKIIGANLIKILVFKNWIFFNLDFLSK